MPERSNGLVLKTSVRKRTGGSNPSSSTNFGLVVQLVRIHACHARGREFESRPDRQLNGELAQLARAPALHAGGHRFDSDILHKLIFDDHYWRIDGRGFESRHLHKGINYNGDDRLLTLVDSDSESGLIYANDNFALAA